MEWGIRLKNNDMKKIVKSTFWSFIVQCMISLTIMGIIMIILAESRAIFDFQWLYNIFPHLYDLLDNIYELVFERAYFIFIIFGTTLIIVLSLLYKLLNKIFSYVFAVSESADKLFDKNVEYINLPPEEEYYTGTIKNVLTKPYTRIKILCSKILINFTIIAIEVCILVLFQYLIGGILFGFESYSLEAIRYNSFSQNIETINLDQYIYVIILTKILMYVIFSSFSLLFGIMTNNMALNVLISLGIYFLSAFRNFTNDISKYIFIYNWDISKYLFGSRLLLNKAIIISSMSLLIIIFMVTIIFKNKDVKNM